MTPLYSAEEAEQWKKRAGACRLAAVLILALAFAGCVLMCFFVRTANAHAMLLRVIALSTLGGWAWLLLRHFVMIPARAEARHTWDVLREQETERQGVLTVTEDVFQIPRSITVRRLALSHGEKTEILHVDERRAALLPPSGTAVAVRLARKYVTAFEVRDA